MSKRYTHETFVEQLSLINPYVEVLSPFTRVVDRIDIRCKRCGKEWSPKAYSLLQGKGCSHCSAVLGANISKGKTSRKTQAQFEAELKVISPTITVTGKYISNKNKVSVQCNICGAQWSAVPNALLLGHGCPRCAKSGTSFMEQFILSAFTRVLGKDAVLSRDKTTIGMELDIIVPSRKFAVEPGNWYLHKRSIKRDAIKRDKCNAAGIRLITIYDQCPTGTKPPFDKDCLIYQMNLNSENHSELKSLTLYLLSEVDELHNFSDEEWSEIEAEATASSRAQTHDDFIQRLLQIRPDIEVVGHFTNVNTRIHVRCRNCGNEWNAIPAQLLSGYGCRKCGTEKAHAPLRKTHEDFLKEMKIKNPNVEVIGKYSGRHSKVAVCCRICGNEWNSEAGSLLSGRGCPNCSQKQAGAKMKKSHADYIAQLHEVNPDIEVIGQYEKTHSKIAVRCKTCGYEWNPEAGSLLAGQGCSVCGRKRTSASNKRKVICIETKEVYPSATDAAKAIGIKNSTSIIQSIKKGCRSGGYHWKYSDSEEIDV